MKLKILVMMVLCLCVSVCVFAEETASSDAEMVVPLIPQTTQVVGETDAKLGPSTYPMFYDYQSNDPACGDYLKKQFKVQTGDEDDGVADSGLTLAPIYLQSKYSTNGWTGGRKQDFERISGLEIKGYEIPEEYRKKAGIMVTWTVRVEGSQTEAYNIQNNLCSGTWDGTSYQSFPGGEVKTKLYAISGKGTAYEKAVPLGPEACMTIPDGGKTKVTEEYVPPSPPGDPTHTGSYLITPDDFDGLLPSTLDLEIRWKNETCQQLTSPANMRSMIVTLMPEAGASE